MTPANTWERQDLTASVVAALVSFLLPESPRVSPSLRHELVADVTAYVVAQIGAMPRFLRSPFGAVLALFEILPILRHGRRFRRLSNAQRGAYVEWWSALPIPPLRDFVKLIRASALFVYFDHPALRSHLEPGGSVAATEAAGVD